jgi:valyl-tRNA synthetase
LIDEAAEREIEVVIDATRRLRNYRDAVGAAASARIPARIAVEDSVAHELYERSLATITRLSRFDLELADRGTASSDAATAVIALPGATVELLESDAIDPEQARARIAERAQSVRDEIERARGKLANTGFVEKAPGEVVQKERDKLARFERELTELERELER